MIEVQRLTHADQVESILPLLREFFKQTRQAAFVPWDPAHVARAVGELVSSPAGLVLVAIDEGQVVGTAAGMLFPLWFGPNHVTGQEVFWYVAEQHRRSKAGKKLFDALEKWAKDAGADSFSMVALSHLHEQRVGNMYEAKGYLPSERSYIKEF